MSVSFFQHTCVPSASLWRRSQSCFRSRTARFCFVANECVVVASPIGGYLEGKMSIGRNRSQLANFRHKKQPCLAVQTAASALLPEEANLWCNCKTIPRAMAALEILQDSFTVDRRHSLQEFVLPESLRYDAAFDNFAAEDQFPVIDLADGAGSREELIAKLARAAETWGFFKVVNHGVPMEVILKIMAHVREFFARPIEEKMQERSEMPKKYEGYTPGTMIVDVDGQHPCWTERLLFIRKPDALQGLAHRVWPNDDGQVSQDMLQYSHHMDVLTQRLIGLLSEALGVASSSQQFGKFHDSTCGNIIAAHYPPCPRPDLARGLRAHTDPHTLSVLYQEYPGLQLLKDGKWLAVKPEVGTLIVNVGDMLQIWSNGRFRSVQHRVALNPTTSRFSLIFFKNPRLDEVVFAPAEVVDEAHPRKYKDVSWKEYAMLVSSGSSKAGHLIDKITIT